MTAAAVFAGARPRFPHAWVVALFVLINVLIAGADPCRANMVTLRAPEAASAILLEPTTGQVLYENEADLHRAPASIAKLMLELIVMERVGRGELRLDESIRASAWASKMGGSQVFLAHGEEFSLEELMKAIAIASANDACVAVAEHIAGSTEGFVDLMNLRAKDLGLTNTRYINVHGLDDEPGSGNVTTARDIAKIAEQLVKHSHVLEWSQIEEAPFRDGKFTLHNTNKLLGDFPGLDGLKTGFTNRAGYCLCATAQRNGMRLISVIMGAESNRQRFRETSRLLGAGFAQMRKDTVVEEGRPVPGNVPVADGRQLTVEVVAGSRIDVVLSGRSDRPLPKLIPAIGLRAPIAQGDTVGTIEVQANGIVQRAPALAAIEMKKATIFQRIGRFLGADR